MHILSAGKRSLFVTLYGQYCEAFLKVVPNLFFFFDMFRVFKSSEIPQISVLFTIKTPQIYNLSS